MMTRFYTEDTTIMVSNDSIIFDHGSSEGSIKHHVGSAEFERVMAIITRQLACGATTADFIATYHLFCHEQECEAWIEFGIKLGMFVCTNEKRGLYTVV